MSGRPWQVNWLARHGKVAERMAWYRVAMVSGVLGGFLYYWTQRKDIYSKQKEAEERWGRHGEKADYGKSFGETTQKGPHFPGIPTTETNAPGGHKGNSTSIRSSS